MLEITLAIMPVFALLMLGFFLRKLNFLEESIWGGLDRLVYWILFPALLFTKTAIAPLGGDVFLPYLTSFQPAIFLSGLFVWLLIPYLKKTLSNPSIGSVYQGAIRYNTYIGFATIVAIYGEEAQFYAALATAVMVPLVNILCVTTLTSLHGDSDQPVMKRVLAGIAKNPLLIAILGGVSWNLTGIGPIPVVMPMLESLSTATLALGLLCVGSGLRIRALKTASLPLIISCIGKFVILPCVVYIGLEFWGITGLAALTAFTFSFLPTAASGYSLARQLGGDVPLIAGLITIQTLVAMFLMPFVILLATHLYM